MSSKRAIQRNSFHTQCFGKKTYDSREEAYLANSIIRRKLKDNNLAVYKCPHCAKFHIGHKIQRDPTRDVYIR